MVKETIEAVLKAEQDAEQTEKDALIMRDQMLAEAQADAQKLISGMTKDACEKTARNMELARHSGEDIILSHERKAQDEIFRIKEDIKRKEKAAIDLVVSELT